MNLSSMVCWRIAVACCRGLIQSLQVFFNQASHVFPKSLFQIAFSGKFIKSPFVEPELFSLVLFDKYKHLFQRILVL